MKVTIVNCDNCRNRLPRVPKGKRTRILGKPVDLCSSCATGNVPVNLDAPVGDWPVFVPSAALAPLLEEFSRRTSLALGGRAREEALERDLQDRLPATPVVAASAHDTLIVG